MPLTFHNKLGSAYLIYLGLLPSLATFAIVSTYPVRYPLIPGRGGSRGGIPGGHLQLHPYPGTDAALSVLIARRPAIRTIRPARQLRSADLRYRGLFH